jgi:hypothetical protein
MNKKVFFGVLLLLPVLLWAGLRIYNDVLYDINCGGHLKRAADANTVELAKQELKTAVSYLEARGMTSGYTSILYRTPDEDVGFWFQNLKASLVELEKVTPETTQPERSIILVKLRETLLDQGEKSVSVTAPSGIGIHPHNVAYAWFGWLSLVAAIVGCTMIVIGFDEY